MTASDPILRFEGLSKRYGRQPVLRDVSLAVQTGSFTVVYGPPAGGKTVLLRILMGLEAPDSGRVVLRGHDVTALPAAARNIGYVPQSFALYPQIDVRANIAYPLHLAHVGEAETEAVVAHAAEMLRITDLLDKRPDQLSGGQKQRVAIARGIAKRTDLYVLDDPLAGLDFKLREQLVEDLRALQADSGATFVYMTSDVIEAMTLADELAVLDRGEIVETGPPNDLYERPANSRTMALVGFPPTNFLAAEVELRDDGPWCRTALFEAPAELEVASAGRMVVGLRPGHLRVETAASPNGADVGSIWIPGQVVLREDLGGEEIIYLESSGVTLTSVDRHTLPPGNLGAVHAAIDPRDLAIFHPVTGTRAGRGRLLDGVALRHG
ncbi:MAG: ABC transporter ATP-binding protein [Thermomicrobiales bacterium]|nr:ABC transporter ATP-binding protein [Thermomicrobiales bacterium]